MTNFKQTDPYGRYFLERQRMVENQIIRRGVADSKILDAMFRIPRHLFVPENSSNSAYADHPLSIGYGQTISQPFIVAYMTESAGLKPGDKVLEVGTGSGYQAAVLAEIAEEVYSVEVLEQLAQSAHKRLKELGYENVSVQGGDGYQGWHEYAPFDVIIVTAAPKEIPPKLVEQLAVGGRMVLPVGGFSQSLYRVTKIEDGIRQEELLPVRFVPMVKG